MIVPLLSIDVPNYRIGMESRLLYRQTKTSKAWAGGILPVGNHGQGIISF